LPEVNDGQRHLGQSGFHANDCDRSDLDCRAVVYGGASGFSGAVKPAFPYRNWLCGLKGFPEAINSVFPQTQIQTCIVHLIRNSLDFCSWKDRKPVARELKTIYRAADAEAAALALTDFEEGPWGKRFAAITALWRRHWTHVIPFFAYPPEVRKMIYTTNAIESLNAKLRRSVRSRGHFPSDEAAMKLIWLQLREITQKSKMPPREWAAAKAQFAVVFGDRFEVNR
jgi:putative transposase